MARGLIDADLGSGLFKKRIARSGAGKRVGYRVLVANRKGDSWFFIEGYAKNEVADIQLTSIRLIQRQGLMLMAMSARELDEATGRGKLKEVDGDAET